MCYNAVIIVLSLNMRARIASTKAVLRVISLLAIAVANSQVNSSGVKLAIGGVLPVAGAVAIFTNTSKTYADETCINYNI